jgi:hypothetical protein
MATKTAPAGSGAKHKFVAPAPGTRYRLHVAAGDLAGLCGDLATVPGRKKALQLLDLYPEPIAPANSATATDIYNRALQYARTALGGDPTSAAVLRAALARLIQRAAAAGAAPTNTAATDLAAGASWLLLPGTYTFTADTDLGADAAGNLPDLRWNREDAFYTGNDALGRFPITARVQVQRNGRWVVAANTRIVIQLVEPQPGAAKNALLDARVNALPNTVQATPAGWTVNVGTAAWNTVQDGARGYVRRTLDDNFNATNPGGVNVTSARGGKRGAAPLNNLLRSAPGQLALAAGARPNSVQATTDAAGEVKFLFCPSRIAGDRFKLRIFVDPWDGNPCDGTHATDPRVETGVLTVYKTIRIAGVVTKPVAANLSRWYTRSVTLGAIDHNRIATFLRKAFLLVLRTTAQDFNAHRYLDALAAIRTDIRALLAGKKYDMQAALPDQLYFPTDATHRIEHLRADGNAVTLTGNNAAANQVVVVHGIDHAGLQNTERITLNGATPVLGIVRWRRLTSFEIGSGLPVYSAQAGGHSLNVNQTFNPLAAMTLKSSQAADGMAVELFGFDQMSPARLVREVVRLNGTTAVNSRHTFSALCAARVVPDDNGQLNQGTISIAPNLADHWPTLELPRHAAAQNLMAVSTFESPHSFTIENPIDYEALRRRQIPRPAGGGTEPSSSMNGWADYGALVSACAEALGFHLTRNATGIFIHRALSGDPESNLWMVAYPYRYTIGSDGIPALPANWNAPTTSGLAVRFRTANLWYPNETYAGGPNQFTYDLTANTLHEVGHVLFLRHHWTDKNWNTTTMNRQQANGFGFPPDHDFHDVCVMSYHHCDGDYCGRCLVKLAGEQLTQIPDNH